MPGLAGADALTGHRLAAVGAGLVALVVALVITANGVGMTNDSAAYLSAAEGLAEGHGLTMPYRPNTEPVPETIEVGGRTQLTAFPPLFPAVVGGVSKVTGWDVAAAARAVNAVAFALTVGLGFAAVRTRTRSWAWAAVAAALLLAVDLVLVHVMAWSEPLFILLTLGALVAVDRFVVAGRWRALVVAVALIVLAVLTRQAGVATGVAAALAMLVLIGDDRRRRWGGAAAAAAAVVVPVLAWVFFNPGLRSGRSATSVAWHPVTLHDLRTLGGTVSDWMVSVDVLGAAAAGAVAIAVVVGLVVVARRAPNAITEPATVLPAIGLVFTVVYLVMLAAGDSVLGVGTVGFGARILAPVHAVVVVAGAVALGRAVAGDRVSHRLALGGVAVLAIIGVVRAGAFAERFDQSADKALTNEASRHSPTLAAVGDLPEDTVIVSDQPAAVWVATGRPVVALPPEVVYATGAPNEDRADQLGQLASALEGRDAVLVLFDLEPAEVTDGVDPALVLGPPVVTGDGQIAPIVGIDGR